MHNRTSNMGRKVFIIQVKVYIAQYDSYECMLYQAEIALSKFELNFFLTYINPLVKLLDFYSYVDNRYQIQPKIFT